jgi:hypothetical protein
MDAGEPTEMLTLVGEMGEEAKVDQNSGGFVVWKESGSA